MKYKIGDILKIKNGSIESMITRIDKNDNTYYLNRWEPEHHLDENYELLTPHEDVNENIKTVHIDVKDVNTYQPWRANHCEVYWFIDDCGNIVKEKDFNTLTDDYRYSIDNYFKTEEKAKKYKEYLIAKKTLSNDAKGFIPNWDNNDLTIKWRVFKQYGTLQTTYGTSWETLDLRFATEEDAKASLDKHKREWDIVLDWENGKR